MFTWGDVWAGLVVPAATSAGLLLVAWRLAQRRLPARDRGSWAGPLAIGAGFVAGYLALFGWPGFPPLEASNWLLFLAGPLAVAGLADSCLRLSLPFRLPLIVVAVPAALLLLARPLLAAGEPIAGETSRQLAVAAAFGAVSLAALDALAVRISAARLSAILLAVAVPAAAAFALSGTLRYGQVGGLLVATEVGALGVYLIVGRAAVGRGTVVVFGTLLGGLLWCGNLYAELESSDAVLLAGAPNLAWLAYLLPRRIGWLGQTLIVLLIVLGAGGIVVVRVWLQVDGEAYD